MSAWKVADVLWLESRGQRCPSRHPERVARCELHIGHEGSHKHTVATVRSMQWDAEHPEVGREASNQESKPSDDR